MTRRISIPLSLVVLLTLAACRHTAGPGVKEWSSIILDRHGIPSFLGKTYSCPSPSGEGAIQLSYPNGKKRVKGRCEGGVMVGSWTAWYDNGAVIWKATFAHGRLEGRFSSFYADDRKQAVLSFKEGLPDGKVTAWWPNGKKRLQGQYVNGKKNGCWGSWHDNGQIAEKGTYADDKRVLTWLRWTASGEKRKEKLGGAATHGRCLLTF